MTIYTQADADAAKAKLALDTQALADDQQAALAAQAGATSAAQAVADAEAALAVAQAALSSANGAVTAVQADMVAQQAIIDAFAAQPPVVTPPPPTTGTMPDMPALPVGPFAKHGTFTVSASTLDVELNKVEFGGSYICIDHTSKTLNMTALNLQDVTCDAQAGTLFYAHSLGGGKVANLGRVACQKVRTGRPFLRFNGVWGPVTIDDLTAIFDPTPNIHTGDIGTGIQIGDKLAGESQEIVHIRRARVENIYAGPSPTDPTKGWQPGNYWNGDGLTAERSLKVFQVDNGYFKNITDGGIDSKARKNVFGRIYVENARAALKVWDDTTCDHLTSINPRVQGGIGSCSHVRMMGNAPDDVTGKGTRVPVFTFPDLTAKGNQPLFHIENGPVKIVATGTYDGSTLLVKVNGGSVTADSTWNGKPIK